MIFLPAISHGYKPKTNKKATKNGKAKLEIIQVIFRIILFNENNKKFKLSWPER